MKQLKLKDVEENFEHVFDGLLVSGEPVKITRDAGNAVLVSEEVWRGMIETLNLVSTPSMSESISSGLREPITDAQTGLDW